MRLSYTLQVIFAQSFQFEVFICDVHTEMRIIALICG